MYLGHAPHYILSLGLKHERLEALDLNNQSNILGYIRTCSYGEIRGDYVVGK